MRHFMLRSKCTLLADIYGHGDVTINGSNTYPVFYIVGDNRGGIDVNIDGMTVENGENTDYVEILQEPLSMLQEE